MNETNTRSEAAKDAAAVASVVQHNIREIYEHRQLHEGRLTAFERLANKIAEFCGRPSFVFLNALFFFLWISSNIGVFGLKPFDPYPFGLLTTIVSLEAIFLSLFLLLSQNRMQALADRQNELDLQVNLLTEHELTRVLVAVDRIAEKLGIELPHADDCEELESDVSPAVLLEEIEKIEDSHN